jgi:hypothetical protein
MISEPKIFFEEGMIDFERSRLKHLAESAHKLVKDQHDPYAFIKKTNKSDDHFIVEVIPVPNKLQIQTLVEADYSGNNESVVKSEKICDD